MRDLDTPSKALLSLQDSLSTEVHTEVLFDYTEEKEEELTEGWGKKFNVFATRANNPCGDGLDTTCGEWHIEIKREKPEGRNPVCNDESKETEVTREESSKPAETDAPKAEVNEPVKKEISTNKEASQTETDTSEQKGKNDAGMYELDAWLDQISKQAHGICTMGSDIISPKNKSDNPEFKETDKFDIKEAWSSVTARVKTMLSEGMPSLRQATANTNQTEEKDQLSVAQYTEMALNGDHDDVTVVTELMGQEKQRLKEKEMAKSKMVEQMKSQVKSAWLSISQKLTFANKTPKESTAPQGKSDVADIQTVKTDDLTAVKTEARSPVAEEGKARVAEENGAVPEDILSLASEALSSIQDSIVEPAA